MATISGVTSQYMYVEINNAHSALIPTGNSILSLHGPIYSYVDRESITTTEGIVITEGIMTTARAKTAVNIATLLSLDTGTLMGIVFGSFFVVIAAVTTFIIVILCAYRCYRINKDKRKLWKLTRVS